MNTLTRQERAVQRASGPQDRDGLNAADRQLLDTIRAQGWDIQTTWMLDANGKPFQHRRGVVKAKPSWSHSIR